jgi:hypothetical protein
MRIISIIGFGPRGSVLLERVITYIQSFKLSPSDFYIQIFDARGVARSTVYDVKSKDILLNTIASQITLYSGDKAKNFGPTHKGPNLYEFYKDSKKTTPFTYLSRRDFRDYFNVFIDEQFSRMESLGIKYSFIKDEVINIEKKDNKTGFSLYTKKNMVYESVYTVLTTGHGCIEREEDDLRIENICSVNDINDSILSRSNVLVKGMGLVFFDIMIELTQGRGGQFIENGKTFKYIPSGKEPFIYPFTRSGIPLLSRVSKKKKEPFYEPKLFTIENLQQIKIAKKDKQLDFDIDVLPLLKQELELVYKDVDSKGKFDFSKICHPEDNILKSCYSEYKHSLVSFLIEDIDNSEQGISLSAEKAVAEAIRDMRDNLRFIVEENGLNYNSQERFHRYWSPIFNRLCVGPPLVRMKQFLALIESGVVKLNLSNNPRIDFSEKSIEATAQYGDQFQNISANKLIKASIPDNNKLSNNPLYLNLDSYVLKHSNGGFSQGGLFINNSFGVLDHDRKPIEGMFAIGIPTEGYKYFTYVLPRPDIPSTFLKDCNIVAKELVLGIE